MRTRIAGVVIFIIAGLVIGIAQPLAPALPPTGHLALMGLVIAVGLWTFALKWVPLSIGGMVMVTIFIAGGLKYSVVLSGFTNRAIWVLIPALYFGFVLKKSGLGRRLAYRIISLFRPSYLTLTISWVIIGLILSALTPSIAIRIAIVIPIATAVTEICQLQGGSKGASYIMLVAWTMAIIPGSGWLTGSLWGPIGMGFFVGTPGLENIVTNSSWNKAMLLPYELLTVLFITGLYKIMKPNGHLNINPDTFRAEYRALGPASFHEKAALTILIITFIMFVTTQLHHIPDVAICIGAFCLLTALGMIKLEDIGGGISWDLVLFLGIILGLSAVFSDTGVSKFLGGVFASFISHLNIGPWLFILGLMLVLFAWRFFDTAQLLPTIPILVPVLPTIATSFGIHPLVLFALFIMAGNCFFISYQQPFAILGETLGGKAKWLPGQLTKAGVVYAVACIITLAITIPYWMAVGLIG